MKTPIPLFAGVALLLVLAGATLVWGPPGLAPDKASGASAPFDEASVHFEQNATDGDAEVVFAVSGGEEGLAKLTVVSPDGHTIIDFTAPNASPLGIRHFDLESPEPPDVESLKAAYPEGVYTFTGATATGDEFHGESTLNHTLPPTISFLEPGEDAENVDTRDLKITWTPVENLAGYIIEVEQDELGVSVTAKLPGSATSFAVPNGFLSPGMEYNLGIGTISDEGNISFVETSFTTAEKQ